MWGTISEMGLCRRKCPTDGIIVTSTSIGLSSVGGISVVPINSPHDPHLSLVGSNYFPVDICQTVTPPDHREDTQSHPTPLPGNYKCHDGSWELDISTSLN